MMTCDTMVRLVHEMYEIANKISKSEKLWITMKTGACPCPINLRSY